MAINSRDARREAERKVERYKNEYISHFLSLFHNSVKVLNTDVPKRYLLGVLARNGAIAYDYETDLYLRFVEIGIDIYGLPREYQLYGANGYTVRRKADEVCILRANDLKHPVIDYLRIQANKIVNYDMAIEQNLEAVKTMSIAECDSDESLLSLVNLYNTRRIGATIAFVNKNFLANAGIRVMNTGATYLIDKFLEARQKTINETLEHLGIGSANTDKRERVQKMEVSASLYGALDEINTMIDTFNYDAEKGNIPIRFELNTSLKELYNEEEANNEV